MSVATSYWSTNGCPRPVGSEFRQREVWAEDQGGGHPLTWIVSAVDTPAGRVIEAARHVKPNVFVAVGEMPGSTLDTDVLVKARAALATDDGWKVRTVKPCSVTGCENPLPMWRHGERNGMAECLPCSTRTVLACVECGMPDSARTTGREQLLAESLCFGCALWRSRLAAGCEVISQDWALYSIRTRGISGGRSEFKGFGGAKWEITFTDGRVVQTDDLWHGGTIPEWFRDRFVPNATVASLREQVKS